MVATPIAAETLPIATTKVVSEITIDDKSEAEIVAEKRKHAELIAAEIRANEGANVAAAEQEKLGLLKGSEEKTDKAVTEGHGHSTLFQGWGDCKYPAGKATPQVDVRHEALKANEKVQGCKKKLKKLQAQAKR